MDLKSDLLTRKEAAVFIGVCQSTLDRLDIPKTRVRQRVFFKLEVLKKWIDDNTGKPKRGKA